MTSFISRIEKENLVDKTTNNLSLVKYIAELFVSEKWTHNSRGAI